MRGDAQPHAELPRDIGAPRVACGGSGTGTRPALLRAEYGKVLPKEDGTPTPRWRTADLYFSDDDTAVAALEHRSGGAVARNALEIATGGVEFLLSDIED